MIVVRQPLASEPREVAEHFDGRATMAIGTDGYLSVARTTLGQQSRTHWHRHSGGQLLTIVEGEAFVETAGKGAIHLQPGDVVWCVPGDEHRHGNAGVVDVTWDAITFGSTIWSHRP